MSRYLLPMVMGLSGLVVGCEKQEQPRISAKDVEEKVAEATGAAADYAKQEKDEYVARAQKAVEEARAEIDELKTGAGRMPARREGSSARSKPWRQGGRWRSGS